MEQYKLVISWKEKLSLIGIGLEVTGQSTGVSCKVAVPPDPAQVSV